MKKLQKVQKSPQNPDIKRSEKLKLVGFMTKGKIENEINQVMDEFAKIVESQ